MTKITFGPEVWARLGDPKRPAELCDESGRTRGYFFPAVPEGAGSVQSPYSDEERRIILDAAFWKKLDNLKGPVEFCDEARRTLGVFHPANPPTETERLESPFSDEELERRAREPGGRPLEEILADLEKRYGQS